MSKEEKLNEVLEESLSYEECLNLGAEESMSAPITGMYWIDLTVLFEALGVIIFIVISVVLFKIYKQIKAIAHEQK